MVPASSESVSALLWGQHCVTYHQYVTCDDWQTSYAVCRTICWLHWHSEKTFSFIAMQKTLSYIHAYIHLYTGSTSTVFQLFQVFLLQTDARLNTYWQDIHIRTMRSRRKWWCGSKMTDCTNSRWWYCIEVRKISKCFICINTMQIISITDNMLQEGSSGVWDIRSVTKHLVKWHSAYCIVHSAYAWEALTSITLYFYSSNFFYFLCICESTDFLLYTVFRKKHLLLFRKSNQFEWKFQTK